MSDSEKILTVYSLFDSVQAEIIANGLRSEGITCFVANANQAGLIGSNIIQVEIMVREEDLDRATAYLKKHHDIDVNES